MDRGRDAAAHRNKIGNIIVAVCLRYDVQYMWHCVGILNNYALYAMIGVI